MRARRAGPGSPPPAGCCSPATCSAPGSGRGCSQAVEIRIPFWKVCAYYHVGLFFNNFLPANIGGDIARVLDASRYGPTRAAALSAVMMDRLIGTVALAGLALVTTLPAIDRFHLRWSTSRVVAFFALSVMVLWAVLPPGAAARRSSACWRASDSAGSSRSSTSWRRGSPDFREPAPAAVRGCSRSRRVMQVVAHRRARAGGARARASTSPLLYFFLFVPLAGGDSLAAHLVQRHRGARRRRDRAVRPRRGGSGAGVLAPVHHLPGRGRGQPARRAGVPGAHSRAARAAVSEPCGGLNGRESTRRVALIGAARFPRRRRRLPHHADAHRPVLGLRRVHRRLLHPRHPAPARHAVLRAARPHRDAGAVGASIAERVNALSAIAVRARRAAHLPHRRSS